MPEFDFSGSFVNESNVKEDDVLVINAMPSPEEKESPTEKEMVDGVLKPKKYMVLNIPVTLPNGTNKLYTPDVQTGRRFQAAWEPDYSKWVKKKFTAKIEKYKAFGADKVRVAGHPIK